MTEDQHADASRSGRIWGALAVFLGILGLSAALRFWPDGATDAPSQPPIVRDSAPRQVMAPGGKPKEASGEVLVGSTAPSLVLPDLMGTMTDLRDFRGTVVILNIWASWCPPCIREMPSLKALHSLELPEVRIVGWTVDDNLPDARGLAKRQGLEFSNLLDPGGDVAARWGTVMFPETWIIDREGTVRERIIGEQDWTSRELLARLAAY
jgi:cytochrome c biogenesis protein CcmG/thiol:disulfide interchange protein DsbE